MPAHIPTSAHVQAERRVSFVMPVNLRAGHNDSACKGPGNFFVDYYPNFEGFLCLFTLPKLFAITNIIFTKILQIS